MRRLLAVALVLALGGVAVGQESNAAKATRKRLQEKITVEIKETGFKAALEEISRETNNKVKFKIDNTSGISNNSKVTIIAKDKTVQAILNELADKYDFGYYVITSDEKDQSNGKVMVRKGKGKERGYEDGKEPKGSKSSRLSPSFGGTTLQEPLSPYLALVSGGNPGVSGYRCITPEVGLPPYDRELSIIRALPQ
jgi:hypothetical protein